MIADLLAQPRLSVITRSAEHELTVITELIEHKAIVGARDELEALFGELLAVGAKPTPKTLDLIGHSTAGKSHLVLGDWVLDATSPTVTAFFRGLADNDVLPRLGVTAVRLLGCTTATTDQGRWTVCALADILGLPVFGTKDVIYSVHYDRTGFADERTYVLVSNSELMGGADMTAPTIGTAIRPRSLDIDALPGTRVPTGRTWPVRIATPREGGALLGLVRRQYGAEMPGLLATPACEVLLPSTVPGEYRSLQALLGGEFVRVYPDGPDAPGLVYPVADPDALEAIIEGLPRAPAAR